MSMTSNEFPTTGFGRFFEDAAARGMGILHRLNARSVARSNSRMLHELPDHVLKDIGIARGDIDYLTGASIGSKETGRAEKSGASRRHAL